MCNKILLDYELEISMTDTLKMQKKQPPGCYQAHTARLGTVLKEQIVGSIANQRTALDYELEISIVW